MHRLPLANREDELGFFAGMIAGTTGERILLLATQACTRSWPGCATGWGGRAFQPSGPASRTWGGTAGGRQMRPALSTSTGETITAPPSAT
jgi:hypothetical protein